MEAATVSDALLLFYNSYPVWRLHIGHTVTNYKERGGYGMAASVQSLIPHLAPTGPSFWGRFGGRSFLAMRQPFQPPRR